MKYLHPQVFFFLGFSLFLGQKTLAQPFNLDWLFQAGMRLNMSILPKLNQDSTKFHFTQVQAGFILPLKGKANISLKELDINGYQNFLNIVAGQRQVSTHIAPENINVNNLSIGFTRLSASLRTGIWVYVANVGILNTAGTSQAVPFGVISAAKVKIRGLGNQNIFGGALAYFNNQVIPTPVIGINRKMSKKWNFRLLFPVSLTFSYLHNKKNTFDFRVNSQVFQTSVMVPVPNTSDRLKERWQYRQFQVNSVWRYRVQRGWFFLGEVGIATSRRLTQGENLREWNTNFQTAPYFTFSTTFNFGKELLGSQIFAME
ncbi:MAG: hypothetical protein NZ551_07410 [Microscillaceae bacterium]|nr:hypothetical protein [Microscillaceae bacterium]MDW8461022.1 hypothetical protein [Cytophagales bacterium]